MPRPARFQVASVTALLATDDIVHDDDAPVKAHSKCFTGVSTPCAWPAATVDGLFSHHDHKVGSGSVLALRSTMWSPSQPGPRSGVDGKTANAM
jgi:hypothetical protein